MKGKDNCRTMLNQNSINPNTDTYDAVEKCDSLRNCNASITCNPMNDSYMATNEVNDLVSFIIYII